MDEEKNNVFLHSGLENLLQYILMWRSEVKNNSHILLTKTSNSYENIFGNHKVYSLFEVHGLRYAFYVKSYLFFSMKK